MEGERPLFRVTTVSLTRTISLPDVSKSYP